MAINTQMTIRRTNWGWSLYYEGELVASANDPAALEDLRRSLSR